MDSGSKETTDLVEAGYWVSQSVLWGFILFLAILLIAGICYLLYQRRVMAAQHAIVEDLREGANTFRYLVETFMPLIHPSAREEMMANYQRRVAGKSAPKRYESLFLRKDGNSYPIELSGAA